MGKTLDRILKVMKINKLENDPKLREELEVYNHIRTIYNKMGEDKRSLTDTEFYVIKIGIKYDMEEFKANIQKCKENGHIQGTPLFWNGYMKSYLCQRCELPYERRATPEEYAEWNKMIHTPMTI